MQAMFLYRISNKLPNPNPQPKIASNIGVVFNGHLFCNRYYMEDINLSYFRVIHYLWWPEII